MLKVEVNYILLLVTNIILIINFVLCCSWTEKVNQTLILVIFVVRSTASSL